MKLAVFGLLVSAGVHLPQVVYAQTDKAARQRAVVKSEQPAEPAISTGDSAIDLLINSQIDNTPGAASAPAVETARARRAARAASAAEAADQSFRDALLHEAALVVANQARADDTPTQVVQVPADEATEAKNRQQSSAAGDEYKDVVWLSAVRSAVAALRENRNWLLMMALGLAGLAIAASLARSRAARGSGSDRRGGPDRRGGDDRRIVTGLAGRSSGGDRSGDPSKTLSRRTMPDRRDAA